MNTTDGDHTVTSWGWEVIDRERWRRWRYRYRGELVTVATLRTHDPDEALAQLRRITEALP